MSEDGKSWSATNAPEWDYFEDVAYGSGSLWPWGTKAERIFFPQLMAKAGKLTGIRWHSVPGCGFDGSRFVIITNDTTILVSDDGENGLLMMFRYPGIAVRVGTILLTETANLWPGSVR